MYVYMYMYIYRHAFQGVAMRCRRQRTSPAQSEPGCASGRWVLPMGCCGKFRIGLTMAAPKTYLPSTDTVSL